MKYLWREKYFSKGDYQRNRVKPLKLERSFWLLLLPRDNLAHTVTPINPRFDGRENEVVE